MAPYLRGSRYVLMGEDATKYLLRDEFVTALAAGLLNGTAGEPLGGRAVVDTENKLSIGATGLLTFSGGKADAAFGDPSIWYPAITRVAGPPAAAADASAPG